MLTSPDGDIAEDQMVTATGSYSATAPLASAGPWIMQMVAFHGLSAGARHAAAHGPEQPDADCSQPEPNQSELDGIDGQRWESQVTWSSAAREPDARTLRRSARAADDGIQRHRLDSQHQYSYRVQGDGCGGESERILKCRQRDNPGAGHTAADDADESHRHGSQRQPDQSELDGVDGQRGCYRLPDRALPGRGMLKLRAALDRAGTTYSDTGLVTKHQLHLSCEGD